MALLVNFIATCLNAFFFVLAILNGPVWACIIFGAFVVFNGYCTLDLTIDALQRLDDDRAEL